MIRLLKKIFVPGNIDSDGQELLTSSGDDGDGIYNLFATNIARLPLSTFTQKHSEVTPGGELVNTYTRDLEYKECRIFDSLTLKVIGGSNTNVIFRNQEPERVDMLHLRTLVNNLYSIYGPDSGGKGLFSEEDEQAYNDSRFYALFGRNWLEYPRFRHPVILRRTDTEISLSVWGARGISG
jgi:hypothetical protein